MAIQHHPCTAMNLGEFQEHIVYNAAPAGEPANWQTDFMHEHGMVTLSVQNNNYKYETIMNKRADNFGPNLFTGE